jgi:NAD(P)H dehydrogenase (quinone)
MTLVISGAGGQLGRAVTAELLQSADPAELVLVTRDPSALDVPGASVRRGDWHDPASLAEAFAGGERMLLISGDKIGARVPGHLAAIDAAVAAGIGFIAYTSIVNPSDSNPIAVAAEHRATEEHIRASGAAWTFLRNNIYADLQKGSIERVVASGRLVTNGGPVGFVARADCARCAAAVLRGQGHEGREYDVTGPEAITPEALAAIFAELGGKPVGVEYVDDDAYTAALGLPAPVAAAIASFGTGARLGYSAVVSSAVRDLTGRDPLTIREVLAS